MIPLFRRPASSRRGFTIPEIFVTMLLFLVVCLMAAPLLIHATRFFVLNRTKVTLQRGAREAMSVMTRSLHQALSETIVIDRAANTQPFFSRITFTRLDGTTQSFAQQGWRLVETRNGASRTVTDHVRFLAFALPRSEELNIVSIALTLEDDIHEGRRKALHLASEKVRVMN